MEMLVIFKEHSEPKKYPQKKKKFDEFVKNIKPEQDSGTSKKPPIPKYLGITKNWDSKRNDWTVKASYYIGIDWLIEKDLFAVVEPKIEGVDYMELFSSALSITTDKEVEYFSNYYGIKFDCQKIKTDSEIVDCLTPLMVIHYIALLQILVKGGLKRGYVHREENLHSKIKGRILFQKHLRKNLLAKREDRIFCGYNEYSVDIPENRLLKKALLFAEKALDSWRSLQKDRQKGLYQEIKNSIAEIKLAFEHVSSDIQISEVRNVMTNKLYKTYKEAVNLAKKVLQKYDYSFSAAGKKQAETYPFWIDMPRLYELFVYSRLKEKYGDQLEFQAEGSHGTAVDFILKNEGLILDAKYKPRYENNSKTDVIEDIREISGYARDMTIRRKFGEVLKNKIIPCVVIYPGNSDMESNLKNDSFQQKDITDKNDKEYLNFTSEKNRYKDFIDFFFYKLSIPMV